METVVRYVAGRQDHEDYLHKERGDTNARMVEAATKKSAGRLAGLLKIDLGTRLQ